MSNVDYTVSSNDLAAVDQGMDFFGDLYDKGMSFSFYVIVDIFRTILTEVLVLMEKLFF